jgi:co-chaperonin GroES (HSP10)
MADEKQDNQKTIVAFVVGLLIGGLLVWAFSGSHDSTKKNNDKTKTNTEVTASTTEDANSEEGAILPPDSSKDKGPQTLSVGEGNIVIKDQAAGMSVAMDSATYPVKEGWIGVRSYTDDKLGRILGVVRFSESQGLVPSEIILQAPTKAGSKYAVVIFSENGDFDFNLADDVQIDQVFTTFTAQ